MQGQYLFSEEEKKLKLLTIPVNKCYHALCTTKMGVNKSVLSEFGHVVGLQMLFNTDLCQIFDIHILRFLDVSK